ARRPASDGGAARGGARTHTKRARAAKTRSAVPARRKTQPAPEIEAVPKPVTCCLCGQGAGDSIPHLWWGRYFADFRCPRGKSLFPRFHQQRKGTVSRCALYGGYPFAAFEHA